MNPYFQFGTFYSCMLQNKLQTKASREFGRMLGFSDCHLLIQFGTYLDHPSFHSMVRELNERSKNPNLERPHVDPAAKRTCLKKFRKCIRKTFKCFKICIKSIFCCSCTRNANLETTGIQLPALAKSFVNCCSCICAMYDAFGKCLKLISRCLKSCIACACCKSCLETILEP